MVGEKTAGTFVGFVVLFGVAWVSSSALAGGFVGTHFWFGLNGAAFSPRASGANCASEVVKFSAGRTDFAVGNGLDGESVRLLPACR